jgi:hypothetical protein
MHAIKSLIVVALAATVSANYFNGELLRREILLQARQTSSSPGSAAATATASTNSSGNACSSVLQGLATLITGLPTPTGALATYLATAATTLTNPCSLSIPSSIATAFVAYESSVISFYSAHISQINSALAVCPSLTNLVANPICSTATGVVTTTATAAANGTSTITASTTASSSSPPQVVSTAGANANPRETGMVAAALAVAGLFGAVAVAL